ncbi:MAG: hypothetical protein H7256_02115 [Bdellovibrio sp.]|nr:hypothetical protein [Bdellovibrio sp.]
MKTLVIVVITLFISVLATAEDSTPSNPVEAKTNDTPAVVPVRAPNKEVFNQILFAEGFQSWTKRDLTLYKKVLAAYMKLDKISDFSDSVDEDFLVSRLLKSEALVFDIHPQDQFVFNPSKLPAGEYTKKEIEDELKGLSYAVALLNLREKQMTQKARFKAWIDVLKRKYQVKIKSDDFPKT